MKEIKRECNLKVRLTPEEKQKLIQYAEARKITMSEAIRQLCEKIFSQNGQG